MADPASDTKAHIKRKCSVRNEHPSHIWNWDGRKYSRWCAGVTIATEADLLAIWWISDEDREALPFIHVPHYLYDQIVDSIGRGARGRLWADKRFSNVDVSEAFDSGDDTAYRAKAAGFVVTRKDVDDYGIADLEIGVVTGLDCKCLSKA